MILVTFGCGVSSKYMHEAQMAQRLRAAEGYAHGVFIQPPQFGAGDQRFTIMDGNGRFLGDSTENTYFAVNVPPGEHLFIGWAENTAALRASVAAGKIYYVHVDPRMGGWSAHVALLALTPRSESWGDLQEWLADATLMLPDEQGGQAYLREHEENTQKRMRRARERFAKYDSAELANRTIRPQDGQ